MSDLSGIQKIIYSDDTTNTSMDQRAERKDPSLAIDTVDRAVRVMLDNERNEDGYKYEESLDSGAHAIGEVDHVYAHGIHVDLYMAKPIDETTFEVTRKLYPEFVNIHTSTNNSTTPANA